MERVAAAMASTVGRIRDNGASSIEERLVVPVNAISEEMAALDAALAPEKVSGPRYGEKLMAQVDR